MLMICYALTQMRTERKYISGFGAVRLSKTEALEVISSKVRPPEPLRAHHWVHRDDQIREVHETGLPVLQGLRQR
eukprot:14711213-Heterocapsa_arctica.AAC.1